MTAADFNAWLSKTGLSDAEIARRLGCARNSIAAWRASGAPLYIALAAAAISYGLPPWRSQ
jgi:transcriptional regulator with XRE-family HTH domain